VHFKDGVYRAYSEATGLTNSFVRSLMEDDQGSLWIGTDNGLFQMIQANSGR
jgi:ligand-binding sensor domain-containing protein